MGFVEMIKERWKEGIQIDFMFLIFLIFFLNVFLTMNQVFFYVLIVLIIANIVFGFINGRKRIAMNIFLLIFAVMQFLFVLGYLATIIGAIVALIYSVVDMIGFLKNKEPVVEEKAVKGKKK